MRTQYFQNRLNTVGIWACDGEQNQVGQLPIGEWIGFSHCLNVEQAGDYLVGIAGDNRVRFKVNGQMVFERNTTHTHNFNYWHIIKVSLNSGVNIIELYGYNDHRIASFGAEISGPFPAGSLETEGQDLVAIRNSAPLAVFCARVTAQLHGEEFENEYAAPC